jgi:hypothetical protein
VQLTHPHREHGTQRALVADPRADEPGQDNGPDDGPGHSEEAEAEADDPLAGQDEDEHEHAHAPGHVPRPKGKGRLGWTQPHGIHAVHLVIGAYLHNRPRLVSP